MHISSLKIKNFRNFDSAEFVFNKGINTILGENGSGKTNALFALRLLLDDSLPRSITKLKVSDFCRNLVKWNGHWIIISIDFEELSADEGCQTLKHQTGHMDETDRGTLTFYFRPCLRVRQQLHESSHDLERTKEVIENITIDDYESIFTGRSNATFLEDETYENLVGDFEQCIFPAPDDQDFKSYGVKVSPVHEEVSFTFVKALRDVISDLKNYRNSPLIELLKDLDSDISKEDSERITELVRNLNTNISDLDEIKQVSHGIQNTLHATVGHTFSPIIDIESSLPSELNKLLQKLSLTVGDNYVDGYSGDLTELSLGGANLIYLALKLLEYERKIGIEKAAQFLVIEEPEAHIHTHIQKTLFENHAVGKTQVFLSTHSTHISSASSISEMNIVGLSENVVEVYQPSLNLTKLECSRIERYLNATRSTLLFAKGIILVEGDAELILIPTLIKKSLGVSLDELGISLVSMDSAFFEHISKLFSHDRIRKNCAIITDEDASIVLLPDDANCDNKQQKHCRNSETSGIQRKQKLEKHCNNNDYVKPFFAKHTFEVDFIIEDNSPEVIDILPNIYDQDSRIIKSTNKLESDNLEIFGREILRLANKEGKGWFSLLLSEKVSSFTYIPKYIIEAISFSCKNSISDPILFKMCQYRLKNKTPMYKSETETKDFFKTNNDIHQCINEFIKNRPFDDLSYLIDLLDR